MTDLKISKEVALPVDAVTERLAFVGQSGSGKTYAAMRLAELMLEAGAQIISLDPMSVWWGLLSAANGKASGYPVHVFGGEHAHVPIVPEAGALVADVIVSRRISAVIDIADFTIGDQVMFASAFAERFYEQQRRTKSPVHLFFEEAHNFLPQNLPPEGRGGDPRRNPAVMLNRMERIVRQGRSQGIGCSMITQQPQAVNKKALNQAGTLFAMRTMGKHERKAISEWMADKATDAAQLDLDALLPKLATGQAWLASPHLLNVFKHVHITRKTTFDSSATPKFGVKLEAPKVLADVDVAALREAMKTVVDKVESDDPAPLRRRIAELERALATRPKPEREIVPILGPEATMAMKALAGIFADAFKRYPSDAGNAAPVPPPRPPPARATTSTPARGRRDELGTGQIAILTAVAQHREGVTREQLSVLTGYKRSSRDTYLQQLSAAGLVERHGEQIIATDTGVAALGEHFEPLPTGAALRQHWLNRLPEGERRILGLLVEAYPQPLTRDGIGEATGYKRSSRDTYLQKLQARRLIASPSRGEVAASQVLFS